MGFSPARSRNFAYRAINLIGKLETDDAVSSFPMLHLTPLNPDDLLKLQQCAIERLQSRYAVLQLCELYVTPENHLSIECFDLARLEGVKIVLPKLEHSSWQTVGVSQINLTYNDHPICQVETRTKLEKTPCSTLEFEGSIKCNLMTPNAVILEAPTATAPTMSDPATARRVTTSAAAAVTHLMAEEKMLRQLRHATGFSIEQVQAIMEQTNTPKFLVGDQVAFSPDAGAEIIKDWALGAAQRFLDGTLTTSPEAGSTMDSANSSAEGNPFAETKNGANRTRKTAAAKSPASESSGGALDGFKPNFSSYAKTAKDVLETLAPKNEKKQRQIADSFSMKRPATKAYLKSVLDRYEEKGKNRDQAEKKLLKEFAAIAAEQPATEAADS